MTATVREVADWIGVAGAVTVLTGAGVSTGSGIPDYRGPDGVWTRDPTAERLSSIQAYVSDPGVRRRAWQARADSPAFAAEPNPAHAALARLERLGRLDTLITQNIDGLHQRAGTAPERLIEVHGTVHDAVCLGCGWRGPMAPVLERVRAGDPDPPCEECGGLLKSATVSFGQALDPANLQRAETAARSCDVFLAVGTSLTVWPIAALPGIAYDHGARLVVANAEPTPYDDLAHAVLRDDVAVMLVDLVDRVEAHVRGDG